MVTPTLCLEQSGPAPTGDCPISSPGSAEGTETAADCTQDSTLNNDGSTTFTITCLVVPGTYELLLVPNFVDTCPSFMTDPGCGFINGGPGLDVIITTSFTPSGSISAEPAKAHGAGQVGDQQKFAFHAWNDPNRYNKTKVRFQIKSNDATRCTFVANSATNVQIAPNSLTGGGTVDIDGLGTVTDSLGHKTGVTYHVHAFDSGSHGGTGDTFQVTEFPVTTCGNANPALTKGNVDVDPAHGSKHS
jgi:hypothetical protein